MQMNANLLDDDGILVIVSLSGLRARYVKPGTFDYAFPRELVACMNAGSAFGWHAGSEGEHTVSVETLAKAPRVTPKAITGGIEVRADDTVLIVPYSAFSFECDGDVKFRTRGRLAAEIKVA